MDWDSKYTVEEKHVYRVQLDAKAYVRGRIVPVKITDVTPMN